MKNYIRLLVLLFFPIVIYSCSSDSTAYIPEPVEESFDDDGIAPNPNTNKILRIQPLEVHQQIDGFGCAFAEWSHRIYTNTKRIEVLEALFSDTGLGLNIFRGEPFPHYGKSDGTYDFDLNAHFERSSVDPFLLNDFWGDTALRVRLGQMWLINELTSNPDKYKIDKFTFSTWSPPAYMKTSGKLESGSLLVDKRKEFAQYLAEFIKGYEDKFNFKVFSISPTNEPNSGIGSWSVCSWTAASLADFIVEDLRPALTDLGLKTNIMLGEHSWWVSGEKYIADAIKANPLVAEESQIAAGHGYFTSDGSIMPYHSAVEAGLKVWNTELSNTSSKNVGWISDGIGWANTFERYLAAGNVNALVWWAGARPAENNEPLIYLQEAIPSRDFELTSRYYALGHYSKFINTGSFRVGIEAATVDEGAEASSRDSREIGKYEEGEEKPTEPIFPSDLSYTSYVDNETKNFTIVVINRSGDIVESLIEIEGEEIENMRSYTSTANAKWVYKKINPSLVGLRSVMIPAESIVTVVGKIR